MSSGWILRASSLVEGRGAYLHVLSSGMRFIIRSYLGVFFPLLEKTGCDKLTGSFQIYHNTKASLSPGYLFSQEPDENGGHRKNAGKYIYHQMCPIHRRIIHLFSINIRPDHELRLHNIQQLRGDGESFPLWAHHSPLFSQRVCGVTIHGGQHAIAMATIGPKLLKLKATPPPLCPPALYRRMALPLNVC